MNLPVNYDLLNWRQRRAVREQYVREQKGLCLYCKQSLSGPPSKKVSCKKINWHMFPRNFLKFPVHLQHDHDTGMTEGAVHSMCNAVMWQYEGR